MLDPTDRPKTRGHRKKERTRRHLLAAGMRVLAEKGQGLTVSDVVAEADVSNGTFYNYFPDREALTNALAAEAVLSLAAAVAEEGIEDPGRRFAVATSRVLAHAVADLTWARVVLRLVSRPGFEIDVARFLRADLDEGQAKGRFETGADDATLDQVTGLILMTIRRVVGGDPSPGTRVAAIQRALRGLGLEIDEARRLAEEAVAQDAQDAQDAQTDGGKDREEARAS
ncbi:MAG: TetR/AcrR family transcriptional regulator [Myxococcota bacterium]